MLNGRYINCLRSGTQKKHAMYVTTCLVEPLFGHVLTPIPLPQKLQPFFPPLDQVQSLNLRAALLRGLEHAKKNGVLGRDAVVRKTMLDECKGERLEEVLAVFSSAVLKKLVAEQQLNEPEYPALAQTLALEHRGYSSERTELNTLVLAHKASLGRLLRDKNAARARFRDFAEVLDLKERSLVRRREQAKVLESQEQDSGKDLITDDVKLDVWRTVRHNWSGNERWMETLLYGDSNSKKDGLLSAPFDRVWRKVQSGRLMELEDQAGGLLEQLDRRVNVQRDRLQRWQDFRVKMFDKVAGEPMGKPTEPSRRQRGIDLGFGAHETLHLGRLSPRKLALGKPRKLAGEYEDLVEGLREELARLDKGNKAFAVLPRARHREKPPQHRPETPGEDVISELSELEDEPVMPAVVNDKPARAMDSEPQFGPIIRKIKAFDLNKPKPKVTEMKTSGHRRQQSSSMQNEPVASPETPPPKATLTSETERPTTPGARPPAQRTAPSRNDSPPRSINISPERPVSPTQLMADQILASMNAASPSPVKKPRHTLSLAQRTRLSMARRGSHAPGLGSQDEDDEPELELLSPRSPPTVTVEAPRPSMQDVPEDDEPQYEDLVARTRRSMAGFEAVRQKAQLERRRSQRKSRQHAVSVSRRDGSSYFPSVDEEGDTTLLLAEELMNNERDDPEAIFKSRPKIKTSPVGTPVRGLGD